MTDVIDYAPAIAGLKRKIEEFQQALASVEALAAAQGAGEPATHNAGSTAPARHQHGSIHPGHVLRRDQFFGMKAPEAVRAYLSIEKQPRSAPRITSDLIEHGFITSSEEPVNSIRTVLKRLEDSGEVVQVKKEWGLTEWYSGLRNKRGKAGNATAERESKPPVKKGAKRAKKGRKIAGAGAYQAFLSEKMKQGMSMADAAAEWKIHKQSLTT